MGTVFDFSDFRKPLLQKNLSKLSDRPKSREPFSNLLYSGPSGRPFAYGRYNLLGLELRKIQSGDFVVRYVFPDMASVEFDIKEGDVIRSINALPSTSISHGQWLDITSKKGQYQICRKRDIEKCFTITSKGIPGYSTD